MHHFWCSHHTTCCGGTLSILKNYRYLLPLYHVMLGCGLPEISQVNLAVSPSFSVRSSGARTRTGASVNAKKIHIYI